MKKKQNLFVGLVAALRSPPARRKSWESKAWLCPKANIRYR